MLISEGFRPTEEKLLCAQSSFIFLTSVSPCHVSPFIHKGRTRIHGMDFLTNCLHCLTPRPMALCPLGQFPLTLSTRRTGLSGPCSQADHRVCIQPSFSFSWIPSSVHAAAPSFPSLTGLFHILFLPPTFTSYLLKKYLFIYLAALSLSCSMRTLSCGLWDRTQGPVHWEHEILVTGPPGKSFSYLFKKISLKPNSSRKLLSIKTLRQRLIITPFS